MFEPENNFGGMFMMILNCQKVFEKAADISLQYHPALKVQKYNVVASKKDFDISKSNFYPEIRSCLLVMI